MPNEKSGRVWRAGGADDAEFAHDEEWQRPPSIFVVVEVRGRAGSAIRALQESCDPRLAAWMPPHLTLAGSSGVGPLPAVIPLERLRSALEPIAQTTAPFQTEFARAQRFMATDIVVLPLDPHGALRALHERIARSGLPFAAARFSFTPHVTLNYYASLTPKKARRLLDARVDAPFTVDHLQCSVVREPHPPQVLWEVALGANS